MCIRNNKACNCLEHLIPINLIFMKTSMLKPLFAAVMGMVAPALSVIASETSDPVPVADRSLFFDIFAGDRQSLLNGA